jgi:hypothetical protein
MGIRCGSLSPSGVPWTREEIEYVLNCGKKFVVLMKEYGQTPRYPIDADQDKRRLVRDFEDYVQAQVAPNIPRLRDLVELIALAVRDVGACLQEIERESYDRGFE